MKDKIAPRIYCIPATKAPIVAVFWRGPKNWSHVGRWVLDERRYEPGAWFHGRLFRRRSDLSPDGRFLCYFAEKPGAAWENGMYYVAVSKLPWLTALHAFPTCGTWTRGYCFSEPGEEEYSKDATLPIPYGLRPFDVVQFAHERRRGWEEAPDSPQRDPKNMWDESRNARMRKPQPGGAAVLCAERLDGTVDDVGFGTSVDDLRVGYSLEVEGDIQLLEDIQWADWNSDGHLLVATRSGKLQIRHLQGQHPQILFEEDLSLSEPSPAPAPAWAQQW